MKKIVLGITGFIGSGKTVVAEMFQGLGAEYIDADAVVHELYKPDQPGARKIRDFFGEEFLTSGGSVNRKKLANVVFNNLKKLEILNKLIHPLVTNEIQKMIDKSEKDLIVIEAMAFEEKFLGRLIDYLIWVECDEKVIFERTYKDRKMSRERLSKVISSQKKPKKIDYVVDKSSTLNKVLERVKAIFQKVKKK